jgi:hypothetical protein
MDQFQDFVRNSVDEKLNSMLRSQSLVTELAMKKVCASSSQADVASQCAFQCASQCALLLKDTLQDHLRVSDSKMDSLSSRISQNEVITQLAEQRTKQNSSRKGRAFEDSIMEFLKDQNLVVERRTGNVAQGCDISVCSGSFPWMIEAKDVQALRASDFDKFRRDVAINGEADLFVFLTREPMTSAVLRLRTFEIISGKLVVFYEGGFDRFRSDYKQIVSIGRFVARIGASHKRVAEVIQGYLDEQQTIDRMRKGILEAEKAVAGLKGTLDAMTLRFRQNVTLLREDGAVPEPWSSLNSFASEAYPEADQTDHDANLDADTERDSKKMKLY